MIAYNLPYIIFGTLGAFVVLVIVLTFVRNNKIRKHGIEADAVISNISTRITTDADGNQTTDYTYYVSYTAQDGRTVEAMLDRTPGNIRIGARVRIKYLPEKPKFALLLR